MVDLVFGLPPINNWELVARCTSHPELKEFERHDKEGKVFLRRRLKFRVQHYSKSGNQSLRIWVDTWDALAEWLAAHHFDKGDAVWMFGKLLSRSARHGGAPGTFFYWMHCYRLFFIPEIPRAERQGDKYLVDADKYDRLMAVQNSGGPPEVSHEQYQLLLDQLEDSKSPKTATGGFDRDLPEQDLDPT